MTHINNLTVPCETLVDSCHEDQRFDFDLAREQWLCLCGVEHARCKTMLMIRYK